MRGRESVCVGGLSPDVGCRFGGIKAPARKYSFLSVYNVQKPAVAYYLDTGRYESMPVDDGQYQSFVRHYSKRLLLTAFDW